MIIKLLPQQIPAFWETIKHVAAKSAKVDMEVLLNELLNEKEQCWIMLNESRILQGMVLTAIKTNKYTAKKTLHISGFASFVIMDNAQHEEGVNFLTAFAKKEQCDTISADIAEEVGRNVMNLLGFKEEYRHYTLKVA